MSALARFIEDEGIATVGISLIRENTELMKPPRALWVPFPLGRPLGVPGDADFQQAVIGASLSLLERATGPVLEDYPIELPAGSESQSSAQGSAWVCPVRFAPLPVAQDEDALSRALKTQIAELQPWYELWCRKVGRTEFGLSGLGPEQCAERLSSYLEPDSLSADGAEQDLGVTLRHLAEDLKAFHVEAASAQGGANRSFADLQARNDWLWRETALAELLRAIQVSCAHARDARLRAVAARALVPRRYS